MSYAVTIDESHNAAMFGRRDGLPPRSELDPMFYPDLESFRKAVADGTVVVEKGCRNMEEYHYSLESAHV